jgi:hypothetical protein
VVSMSSGCRWIISLVVFGMVSVTAFIPLIGTGALPERGPTVEGLDGFIDVTYDINMSDYRSPSFAELNGRAYVAWISRYRTSIP